MRSVGYWRFHSNPSLSALKAYKKLIINLVGFFRIQKVAPKMHQTPFLRTSSSYY